MNRTYALVIVLLLTLCVSGLSAQNYGNGLPATDDLGRRLPESGDAGAPRRRFVGLFYWTWHTRHAYRLSGIPSRIIAAHPGAAYDYGHPAWPEDAPHNLQNTWFWAEPLFGFYRDTDRWVLRKHAEMLADAGVDVIFFDCTNGSFTWKESYMALCEVFAEARRDGVNTPQIAFMLAFGPTEGSREAIKEIYRDLYKPAKYGELFFRWDGKPLIMAYPEMLCDVEGDDAATRLHREIRDYFTFRPGQPVYNVGPQRPDHWGWLEIYPQHGFAPKPGGGFEQVTVGVSQNWTAGRGLSAMNAEGAFGRSYTAAHGHDTSPGAVLRGLNFQEQWDRAIEIDPDMVFVTGWNEWIVGRHREWSGQPNAFPDQFDEEHSRDIEPMRGGHGDNYYYQMVANIRRFKGMPAADFTGSAPKRIRVDGRFGDWSDVGPEYRASRGNAVERDSRGWGDAVLRDTSARNDIVAAKVARDDTYVYFYVECADTITQPDGGAWMRLFIDIDRDHATGWEGYDFVVNRVSPRGRAVVERNGGGWVWERAGEADFRVGGRAMELRIPRRVLGLERGADFEMEFKWVDNSQHDGDISDFWVSGDAAPSGRYNYLYRSARR